MAFSTYTELQAAVASWLNRTDLTSQVPDFIALAEAQMNRRLRVRQMVTRSEATFSSGVEFIADPGADMLEPISLTLEISESDIRLLERLSQERLLSEKVDVSSTGEPEFYAHVGTALQLLPIPSQDYTGELTYYAKIPALASNSSNWVLASWPDAYLYGALLQGSPFLIDDDRAGTWGALFQAALDDIQKSNRVPGGRLRVDPMLQGQRMFGITRGW